MKTAAKRATVYLDDDLHRALRLKAADTARSISDLVNEAVKESLAEDEADISAYRDRVKEPVVSYEEFVKDLKKVAAYNVFIKKSAASELEALPKKELTRIMERIGTLRENPRPHGSEKLAGVELYRIRQGSYRIVYSIEDDVLTVWVVKVGHRREVYR